MHAGITFSPEHGQFGMLYTAMSRIEGSMEDSSNKGNVSDTSADDGGPNHIRHASHCCAVLTSCCADVMVCLALLMSCFTDVVLCWWRALLTSCFAGVMLC